MVQLTSFLENGSQQSFFQKPKKCHFFPKNHPTGQFLSWPEIPTSGPMF